MNLSALAQWVAPLVLLSVLRAAEPPAAGSPPSFPPARFEFRDGDMVVLLGTGFFERDYDYGHLEASLVGAAPDKKLRFRNLAWNADTVRGHSRSYFGPPREGLDRLRRHLEEIKPTALLCNYGAAEAWEGTGKLSSFLDGYGQLLDMVGKVAGNPRVLLISPLPVETLPSPLPNLDGQNERLAVYGDAIRKLAGERGHSFYDAFETVRQAARPGPLTEDGVTYSEAGYRFAAGLIARALQNPSRPQAPVVDEKLRSLVFEKNTLFFHRWRPANETYLFGFRKHEQGNNAAEIPLFDPLIEAKEKEVFASLGHRQP